MNYKRAGLLLLSCFCSYFLYAQTGAPVSGQLIDSAEHRSLKNAVVSLLRGKDSSLVTYTRVSEKGSFAIPSIDTGSYILMVTHPYFADYFDNISIHGNTPVTFGNVKMYSKLKMLEEVIVKSGSPIRIKGDTTVYTADSFKVREGANVEELLKKLPGIQVDSKGQIKAMGETVKNVLVDGEEFFGNDPGIATKNLRADMVKEVEVYDKKSDQAVFTGIDDGKREKTINLKMKENAKKGYFGKIEAGGGLGKNTDAGTANKFNNAAMINAFKGKRKIAAYGIMSNTGTLNLNWNDADKYGGSSADNVEVLGDGMIMVSGWNDDRNSSEGIPTNWNGGLHYSNKFDNDKQSVNIGYKFAKINAPAYNRTFARNFLKLGNTDSTWLTNTEKNAYSSSFKQNINLTYEIKLDSANTLKWIAKGNRNNTTSDYNSHAEYTDTLGRYLITNRSHGSNESDRDNFNTSLLWMHKFKKTSRTLSINAAFDYTKSQTDGLQYTNIGSYNHGDSTGQKIIDQRTLANNISNNFNTKISYTEPLKKDVFLILSYAMAMNNSRNNRAVNEPSAPGRYDVKIDSLSNDFVYNNISYTPGLDFRITKKKYSVSFGANSGFTSYQQKDRTEQTERNYNFVNYYPHASFNYKIKPSEGIYINYYGASNAPSLDQLQPVKNIADPLNQRVGNPDLIPSFRHGFSLWYNNWKMLKERGIWGSANYSFTQNAFVQLSRFFDTVRTYQPVNQNGVYNFSAHLEYNRRLKGPNIRIGFGPNINFAQNIDMSARGNSTDITRNVTKTRGYGINFTVGKDKDDKYSIYLSPNFGYNTSVSSANTASNVHYWTTGGNADANWTIVKTLDLHTDAYLYFQQKNPQYPGNSDYIKWNASLTKKFKKDKYEAKAAVYDILDQNRGYNRNFNSSSFTESYTTVLRRFWMVSFIWNITKSNAAPASK